LLFLINLETLRIPIVKLLTCTLLTASTTTVIITTTLSIFWNTVSIRGGISSSIIITAPRVTIIISIPIWTTVAIVVITIPIGATVAIIVVTIPVWVTTVVTVIWIRRRKSSWTIRLNGLRTWIIWDCLNSSGNCSSLNITWWKGLWSGSWRVAGDRWNCFRWRNGFYILRRSWNSFISRGNWYCLSTRRSWYGLSTRRYWDSLSTRRYWDSLSTRRNW